MRLFPGQDFMNETDCVLQGKRLLCILQIKKKKASANGMESTSQIQPGCGDRKSTSANDIFPESLSRKSWDKEWMLSTSPRSRQTQNKVDSGMSTGREASCLMLHCNLHQQGHCSWHGRRHRVTGSVVGYHMRYTKITAVFRMLCL